MYYRNMNESRVSGTQGKKLRQSHDEALEFRRPEIVGILNCTPDSFYAPSRQFNAADAMKTAIAMIRKGADIIDVGGESTRPGSSAVDEQQQLDRVIPVIKDIRSVSDIPISIDTRSARVAEAALDAGADIINDISAFSADPNMARLAAERQVQVVIMHMRGTPAHMQDNPYYQNPVNEIREYLLEAAEAAIKFGVRKENIILDPGIGFGKRFDDNMILLSCLREWRIEGFSVLVGLSRKSFLGKIIDDDDRLAVNHYERHVSQPRYASVAGLKSAPSQPEDRLIATVAAHAWCLLQGVDFLRAHDIRELRQLIAVWEALSWTS